MKKLIKKNHNRGMTYVELIVVLAIFAILSSVVVFNYGAFQTKVDIKNLGSDIALQIVQAQKSSLNGLLPIAGGYGVNWKPAYGVYFNLATDNKSFVYFADLNNDTQFDGSSCPGAGECLNKISITKGNSISQLGIFGNGCPATVNNLTVVFKRPDSSAIITSSPALSCVVSYVQIGITSSKGITAVIKLYPSGRVEVD